MISEANKFQQNLIVESIVLKIVITVDSMIRVKHKRNVSFRTDVIIEWEIVVSMMTIC